MRWWSVVLLLGVTAACSRSSCSRDESPSATAGSATAEDEGESALANPPLPGLGDGDPALTARLEKALAAKGPDYEPRTHHLEPDGSPTYTNRLIEETSPYLLQHAHNPVSWYPWGDDAFERARRENKPVLLSIGYSTCHWCHVMERESFEDVEIARYINENYVPIKVDREERPDVDDIYMRAVKMLSGRGGWPMTTLLTPDRKPFFGGTYFPARDGDRGARKGFLTILKEMKEEYDRDREDVVARAEKLSRRLRSASEPAPPGDVPGPGPVKRAVSMIERRFDDEWGGFGRAPKFPRPANLELLLRHHRRTGEAESLRMVTETLERMAAGGIYDQVGGGFHRYATDRRWLVPHFEKMLYDNAQLVPVYLAAHQVTGQERFAEVAAETLDYIQREMTDPNGGFYSATDADSETPDGEHEEGYFFTWTPAELERTLGADLAGTVRAYYGVTSNGNFEGRTILHRPREDAEVAAELDLTVDALRERIDEADAKLLEARSTRPPPLRDEKILTAWNGLMISAFARAGLVLDEPAHVATAEKSADFLLREMRDDDGRLRRSFKDGRARHAAYLNDYAFLIRGLLDLYEASSEPGWLEQAVALQERLDQHHWDPAGGYFMTADDHEELLVRDKPLYDGALPSGNSVAVMNLLRLAELTQEQEHRERAERSLAAFAQHLARSPTASPQMLSALERYHDVPLEVFIVAPEGEADPDPLVTRVRSAYLPNGPFVVTREGDALDRHAVLVPLLEGKRAQQERVTAYVCERGRCELPTSDPAQLARQLEKVHPLGPATR
ncbi:MAG: thioredoxin domain-containing protein [Myxococcota bacterium]